MQHLNACGCSSLMVEGKVQKSIHTEYNTNYSGEWSLCPCSRNVVCSFCGMNTTQVGGWTVDEVMGVEQGCLGKFLPEGCSGVLMQACRL